MKKIIQLLSAGSQRHNAEAISGLPVQVADQQRIWLMLATSGDDVQLKIMLSEVRSRIEAIAFVT